MILLRDSGAPERPFTGAGRSTGRGAPVATAAVRSGTGLYFSRLVSQVKPDRLALPFRRRGTCSSAAGAGRAHFRPRRPSAPAEGAWRTGPGPCSGPRGARACSGGGRRTRSRGAPRRPAPGPRPVKWGPPGGRGWRASSGRRTCGPAGPPPRCRWADIHPAEGSGRAWLQLPFSAAADSLPRPLIGIIFWTPVSGLQARFVERRPLVSRAPARKTLSAPPRARFGCGRGAGLNAPPTG